MNIQHGSVALLIVFTLLSAIAPPAAGVGAADAELRTLVELDWAAQERLAGRAMHAPAAIAAALQRGERLLADLGRMPGGPDLSGPARELKKLAEDAGILAGADESARLDLYRRIRWQVRDIALANPLVAGRPIVFMQRRRFVCQMLHEYLAYYYDGIQGGGIYVLEEPGRSLKTRDLIAGRLPAGNYTTLALSYDAKTAYFAFAPANRAKPNFYRPEPGQRYFHLYSISADGSTLKQLSDGPNDDFDPCPLPDGGIAFISSRRGGGFTRCNNPWEPLPACTLHRMDADGKNIRTLSPHETNEWHPFVLNDGRIAYSRWDYVDRSAANFHGLWTSNPDGSNPTALFGNYTMRINACYQPRAIPGSDRIAFIAGAHHADVGGSLCIVDPRRTSLDPKSGEDRLDSVEVLTPGVCFPESDGWPNSFFHAPWPLSENYFLVGYASEKLPGMSSGNAHDAATGLYYFDRFGNLELLYRDAEIASMYPIPLTPRPSPPVVRSLLDREMDAEGEFLLNDVTQSLLPLPEGRPVRQLRVFQILPKSTHIANEPRIGHANAESARMLLGTVPVEEDGSAFFRAPAGVPIYFQAVDGDGRAVQTMRSATYLQPGERRSCVGCHEPPGAAPTARTPLASRRPASKLQPGPDGTHPFSFPRLVQPVLDRHCVRCHDGGGGEDKSPLLLTGDAAKGPFSRSYESLKPFLRWYEWGDASISQIASIPGKAGADASRLPGILADAAHAGKVKLTRDERLRLNLWLDGNAPFYGTYEAEAQAAQRRGEAVAVPRMR